MLLELHLQWDLGCQGLERDTGLGCRVLVNNGTYIFHYPNMKRVEIPLRITVKLI